MWAEPGSQSGHMLLEPITLPGPFRHHDCHLQMWWTPQNLLEGRGMSFLQIVCWLFSAHNHQLVCLSHSETLGIGGVSLLSPQSSKSKQKLSELPWQKQAWILAQEDVTPGSLPQGWPLNVVQPLDNPSYAKKPAPWAEQPDLTFQAQVEFFISNVTVH